MKYTLLFVTSIFLLVFSIGFLVTRAHTYLINENRWGNDIFSLNNGNYTVYNSRLILDKTIVKTFEGTIISRKDTSQDGTQGIILNIEPLYNKKEGENMEVFIPWDLNITSTKAFSKVDLNGSSEAQTFDTARMLDSDLIAGNGLYLEIMYSADSSLTPLKFNNFVVVINPW